MTLHAKNLLIEMQEYAKAKIRNADLPPFVPSTEELRKLYNEVSCVDMSLYADDAVIKDLEKMITDESLEFSKQTKSVAEGSAKEIEKIDENSTDKDMQDVIDRLNSNREKYTDLATETTNNVYDSLIEAVEEHPDNSDVILKMSETFLDNFALIMDAITAFLEEVFENLVTIGKTIWDLIEKVWKEIVKAINGWFPSSVLA